MVASNKVRLALLWVLMFLLFGKTTFALEIKVTPDRAQIFLDESFNLVFTADGGVDGDPNFAFLAQNFEILRQSESSRMQIINGTLTRKKEWTVTLMAKSAGTFMIPPIAFGDDRSQVMALNVEPAKKPQASEEAAPIFIEVSVDSPTAYVQSQVIFTMRLFRAQTLTNASLSEPKLSDADAVVERLGDDRQFETTRHGQNYLVLERRYAIFPQQSGTLTVAPIQFEGQMVGRFQNRTFFNQGGGVRRLRSKSLTLNIQAVPQDKVRGRWLPAKELLIYEQWPEIENEAERFKAGEPVTRTLTLKATGLTAAQLPEIPLNLPKNFKSYPDQAELKDQKKLSGLVGIRREKIALIPTAAGSYVLPAIEIPWWNTKLEQMEMARLPERRIQVAPAEETGQSLLPPQNVPATAPTIFPPQNTLGNVAKASGFWSLLSLVLGLGWAVTLILWWGSRQRTNTAAKLNTAEAVKPDFGPIKKELKRACLKNDAGATKEALLSWARLRWPARPASLGEIRNKVPSALADEIAKLNTVLYRPGEAAWDAGAVLWDVFEKVDAGKADQKSRKTEALAPMVP